MAGRHGRHGPIPGGRAGGSQSPKRSVQNAPGTGWWSKYSPAAPNHSRVYAPIARLSSIDAASRIRLGISRVRFIGCWFESRCAPVRFAMRLAQPASSPPPSDGSTKPRSSKRYVRQRLSGKPSNQYWRASAAYGIRPSNWLRVVFFRSNTSKLSLLAGFSFLAVPQPVRWLPNRRVGFVRSPLQGLWGLPPSPGYTRHNFRFAD